MYAHFYRTRATFLTAIWLVLSAVIAAPAMATPVSIDTMDSQQIINQYRDLRASCAQQQGPSQKACYSRLNSTTLSYQRAKQQVRQTNPSALLLSRR